MNQTIAISAVIPTFNRLTTLQRAIDSVLAQQFPVEELIVVDDGSTDGTSEWVRAEYPEVILLSQPNRGVSHARNRAIRQAKGQWIALLDSDDYWYPNKLAEQVIAISQNAGYRLCHCDEHWFRNGNRVNPKAKHQKTGGYIFEQCLPLCAISPSATLLHHSVFNDIGYFDETLPACEDYDLWLRLCAKEPVLFVNQALLAKTGGHQDQLSRHYPAMDQFRLKALAKLLRTNQLNSKQQQATLDIFEKKLQIFCNGARKRQRFQAAEEALANYQDLLTPTTHL